MAEDAQKLLADKYGVSTVDAINEPTPEGGEQNTALHVAARSGSSEDVAILLQGNADVNVLNECESTPLLLAALGNHLDAVNTLLEAGSNPNARDNSGATPLHYAAGKAFCDVVRTLLSKGGRSLQQDEMEQTSLEKALNYRLQDPPEVVETVRLLKESEEAAKGAAQELLKETYGLPGVEAIDVGVPADSDGGTALIVAAREGKVEDVKVLLGAGAKVGKLDQCESTALHHAALEGHEGVVRELLDAGADPNAKDNSGTTPLHYGAQKGFAGVVKALLARNADATIVDELEKTARGYAEDNRKQEDPCVMETLRLLASAP